VWQLLGVEKIQNGGRCHGNQGAKNVKLTAAKFVQPIPTFLAYSVLLDVDVFPIKFHQFLFRE
jgi:hypothetical protein